MNKRFEFEFLIVHKLNSNLYSLFVELLLGFSSSSSSSFYYLFYYSRTPLFRSPKGNEKKFEIAGLRNNRGSVKGKGKSEGIRSSFEIAGTEFEIARFDCTFFLFGFSSNFNFSLHLKHFDDW